MLLNRAQIGFGFFVLAGIGSRFGGEQVQLGIEWPKLQRGGEGFIGFGPASDLFEDRAERNSGVRRARAIAFDTAAEDPCHLILRHPGAGRIEIQV